MPMESPGKTLSMFCMHPENNVDDDDVFVAVCWSVVV